MDANEIPSEAGPELPPGMTELRSGDQVERLVNFGICAYDLEPPGPLPPSVTFTPMRGLHQIPARLRYSPPPLPDGRVRVSLQWGDHDEATWYEWTGADSDRPWDVHEIPADQRDRWAKAMADYQAMRDEAEALMEARHREPGWPNVPPGWEQKPFMPVRP